MASELSATVSVKDVEPMKSMFALLLDMSTADDIPDCYKERIADVLFN
ncbi:MAG: hypothetical protein ACLUDH_14020 [Faecalispora sporosphaeroides]|nr:MAG TPA: hypothetical protein [Caudoviricetes sp.]